MAFGGSAPLVACLALAAAVMLAGPVTGRQLLQTVQYVNTYTPSTQASMPAPGYQVPQQAYVAQVPPTTYIQQPPEGPLYDQQPATPTPQFMPPMGQPALQQQQPLGQQAPASGGGDAISDPVLKGVLDQHNMYRAAHQVAPLSWSASLAADATAWANRCVFQHSGPGECLAMGHQTFTDGVNDWYKEVSQYNFAAGQYSPQTGHFTQMVWKASTQLGCGYAPGCKLYVCHYSPYGNVIGQFVENVFPAVRN